MGESIAFGFYRTDLAPSSLGLYEKPQAILSHTDRANEVNKSLILDFSIYIIMYIPASSNTPFLSTSKVNNGGKYPHNNQENS